MKIHHFVSFIKFALSGVLSVVLDQGLFALFQKVIFAGLSIRHAIVLATLFSRAISSAVNFGLNRTIVFEKSAAVKSSIVRYYILCLCQMTVSAVGVMGLNMWTSMDPSMLKIIVDGVLFFASYLIQRMWVFKGDA